MFGNLRQLLVRPAVCSHEAKPMENLYRRFRRWQERRKGIETLRNMPDFLLKDIGLTRSHLDYPITVARSNPHER
jgi:uncharacterized protein YjiS (DUF1127 family)